MALVFDNELMIRIMTANDSYAVRCTLPRTAVTNLGSPLSVFLLTMLRKRQERKESETRRKLGILPFCGWGKYNNSSS